jgi:hypothetical protein
MAKSCFFFFCLGRKKTLPECNKIIIHKIMPIKFFLTITHTQQVRQIPAVPEGSKSSTIGAVDGCELVCRRCGKGDKLWSKKGQRKRRKGDRNRSGRRIGKFVDREDEEEEVDLRPSLLYGPWQTIAQIVNRKVRNKSSARVRRRPTLTERYGAKRMRMFI